MIYITQLIFIYPGREDIFNQFEDIAIPLISKYRGRLLLRIRPSEDSFLACDMERPYEIHLVSFETQQDFDDFARDEDRKAFLYLKEQSIKSSMLVLGKEL